MKRHIVTRLSVVGHLATAMIGLVSAGLAQVVPQPATATVAGFIYFAVAIPWFLIVRCQARRAQAVAKPGSITLGQSSLDSE